MPDSFIFTCPTNTYMFLFAVFTADVVQETLEFSYLLSLPGIFKNLLLNVNDFETKRIWH